MIPINLRLENFLSYGEELPPLDFRSFHLACLTGQNGHGKSSLLDAITWALWGQARKAASALTPDSFLLKQGEKKMWVELVFDLGRERFKIYREFIKGGKNHRTRLELFVFDPSNNEYRSLTENSKKITQEKISKLLGLDYSTFINSAFIVQGKADEFTKKTARERKNVLANILNLHYYEELETLAKNKAKEAATKREILNQQNQLTTEEEEFITRWPAELTTLQTKKKQTAAALHNFGSALSELKIALSRYELKQKEFQLATSRSPKVNQEIASSTVELQRLTTELAANEKILTQEGKIKKRSLTLNLLKKKMSEWEDKRKRFTALNEKKHLVEIHLNQKSGEMEKAWEIGQSKIDQNQERLKEIALFLKEKPQIINTFNRYEKAVEEEKKLTAVKKRRDSLQIRLTSLRQAGQLEKQNIISRLASLKEEKKRFINSGFSQAKLQQQKNSLKAKLDKLEKENQLFKETLELLSNCKANAESMQTQIEQAKKTLLQIKEKDTRLNVATTPACPLCESELPPQKKERLLLKLQLEESQLTKEIDRLKKERKKIIGEINKLGGKLKIQEREVNFLKKQTEALKISTVTQEEKNQEREKRLMEIDGEIKKLEVGLKNQEYLSSNKEEILSLESQLTKSDYQDRQHEELLEFLKNEAGILSKRQLLQNTEEETKRLHQKLAELKTEEKLLKAARKNKSHIAVELKEITALENEISTLAFKSIEYESLKNQFESLESVPRQMAELDQAAKEKPRLEIRIIHLNKDLAEKKSELKTLKNHLRLLEQDLKVSRPERNKIPQLIEQQRQTQQAWEKIIAKEAQGKRESEIIKQKEKEVKRVNKQMAALGEEKRLWELLQSALGKNGIPALIIENVLPELETTANDILNRLTNGRTQLAFATTRDLKSGESRETLEIIISDEQGPRNYEMFSGGEAFRINFAIRIAIAKLLAHRAGASLKILIIDEGFGTQDEEGLGYLIDAINHISSDFEKLIVVTHLPDLQQAFPVRIEVEKHPEYGSRFQVVGV